MSPLSAVPYYTEVGSTLVRYRTQPGYCGVPLGCGYGRSWIHRTKVGPPLHVRFYHAFAASGILSDGGKRVLLHPTAENVLLFYPTAERVCVYMRVSISSEPASPVTW